MASSSVASQSISQPSNTQSTLKLNSNYVGWDYEMLVVERNMDKIQCIKCGKIINGGIYRLKAHIAHITCNVAPSSKASKEDEAICRNAINEVKLKKRKKKDEAEELRSQVNIDNDRTEEDFHRDQLEESLGPNKSKRTLGPMDKFASVINRESCTGSGGSKLRDQNISDVLFKQRTEAVRDYVCRWVYEAGIPFNNIELDSFKLITETIGQFGPGYVPATRYEMTVPCL